MVTNSDKTVTFTREQFEKGELNVQSPTYPTYLEDKMVTTGRKKKVKKRIQCKKCPRTFIEEREVSAFSVDGQQVEAEYLDLCRICFKKFKKGMNKGYKLATLVSKGVITEEFVEKYQKGEIPEIELSKLLSNLERKII